MLGADSRSSVGRIGPPSSSLVRAAPDCCAALAGDDAIVGAGDGREMELRSFTRRSLPRRGLEQLLDENRLLEAGRLRGGPTLSELINYPAHGKA